MMSEIDHETECLVFRTSLSDKNDVQLISEAMNAHPDILDWSVDLENWEKVLRVECRDIQIHEIKSLLRIEGFFCNEMEA